MADGRWQGFDGHSASFTGCRSHPNHLPGVRIGIYCSAMSKQERMKVFEEFKHKRIDVLLCTTVIEDTPSVENTTMIIVEKAEPSNAVRLHRLRDIW